MLTTLKSSRSGEISVRTRLTNCTKLIRVLDWQLILRKMTMAIVLCAPLLGASQAEAAVSTKTIPVIIQAEDYSNGAGVKSDVTTDGDSGFYIGSINSGDWVAYLNHKVVLPVTGEYVISYRVASPYSTGAFTFNNLNSGGSVSKINRIAVPKTGGWQTWVTIQRTVTLKAGPHFFGLKATSGGFNINWISITNVSSGSTSSVSSVSSSKASVASSSKVSSVASSVKSSVASSSKAASVASSAPVKTSSSAVSASKVASSLASSSKVSSSAVSSSKLSSSSVSSSKLSSSSVSSSKVSSSSVASSKPSSSSAASKSSVSSNDATSGGGTGAGYTQVAGPVGLTWIAPKLREDKSILDITELGGYQIRYKSATDTKYVYVVIKDPWTTTYNFSWLEGSYTFEIAAFDDAGVLSDFSSFIDNSK